MKKCSLLVKYSIIGIFFFVLCCKNEQKKKNDFTKNEEYPKEVYEFLLNNMTQNQFDSLQYIGGSYFLGLTFTIEKNTIKGVEIFGSIDKKDSLFIKDLKNRLIEKSVNFDFVESEFGYYGGIILKDKIKRYNK